MMLKSLFSDDEGDKEYEQTMDYREMMKNQANQAIDENFGDELVIPLPEVSERWLGHSWPARPDQSLLVTNDSLIVQLFKPIFR